GAAHVWVEKILETDEALRDWPVEGTVGYEFLNDVAALWVDPAGLDTLDALWRGIDPTPFGEVAHAAKLEQASGTFANEVERLGPLGSAEALARFPVYRTYVEPDVGRVDDADRAAVAEAGLAPDVARALLLEEPGHEAFVTRFQQTSPPVMAKGVEDTAFYRYNRLLALNEVGGDPGRFGRSVEELHATQAARRPNALLTTFTHDTKRSGDVRARLAALTWIPDEWAELVRSLAVEGEDEYHVLQTVVGAWPLEPERLDGYVEKALREGKRSSGWTEPNEAAERRVQEYGRRLLESREVEQFVERLRPLGQQISLGQTLLKLTSPGIPDLYQGDELETLALVDPDNRRRVAWELRRRLLGTADDPKLRLTQQALSLRARRPEAFTGSYEPVEGDGLCAFARAGDVLVAVPVRPGVDVEAGTPWREVVPGLYER
ncbi:MAG: malto-oligosyltrehalose synthase, partial [Gaiellaceae bacterium]